VSAAKHTPGPWHVSISGPTVYALHSEPPRNRFTAHVQAGRSDDAGYEELLANARLIKAAPDMLEALRLASTAMSCTEALLRAQGHPDADAMAVGLQHIDAAIACATGSSS
jgi:hypothetical protein